jgi:hypothetical protein
MFGEYRKDGNLIKIQILQDFATVSLVLILFSIQIGVCIFVKYGIFSTTRLGWNVLLWVYGSEWLLFNANLAIFQLYHGENKLSKRWWWGPLMLSWIFIVLAHWNNSPRIAMSLHSDTLFWFRANQSLLFL